MASEKSEAQIEKMPYDSPLCIKFIRAILVCNWDTAISLLQEDKNLTRAQITPTGETVLQIAAMAAEEKHSAGAHGKKLRFFVKKLLEHMESEELKITNSNRTTALHFAASAGNLEIAQLLVQKNETLASFANLSGVTPLYLAALSTHKAMVEYLLRFAEFKPQTSVYGCTILNMCISAGFYGIAIQMVSQHKFLAMAKDENGEGPLCVLARKPLAFAAENGNPRLSQRIKSTIFWKKVNKKEMSEESNVSQLFNLLWDAVKDQRDIENLETEDYASLMFVAAMAGNYEFLVHLLHRNPLLVYKVNECKHSIFHIAVLNRNEPIFSLIYEIIGGVKDIMARYREDDNTNMLHLAARLAPSSQLKLLPGAALQMQRELLWYKEVEKIVPISYRDMTDKNGKTPHDLFMENHNELMEKGEKWMKTTAQSCMIVATLITTVVFTTAFTTPGGNDDKSGMPILLSDKFFVAFVISEIIAMLSSSTSIIMFLCILTSRYGEEDFVESLPFWLLTGITTLFISLAAMMVAFCTTFLLFDRRGLAKVPTLLGIFTLVPMMFMWFKYPLLIDILSSTYGSTALFKPRRRLI